MQEYTTREQKEEVGQDKIRVYKTTYKSYDAQDNLKETTIVSSKNGVTTRSTYNGKNKLVKVEVDRPDKSVKMEPSRGTIGKLFGRLFGGKSGDRGGAVVSVVDMGHGRKEVNEQLQQIARDSSLTSSEKRTARRQVVADYHRGSAPNANVGAALKKAKDGR